MCSCTNWRFIPSSGKGPACVAVRTGALIPIFMKGQACVAVRTGALFPVSGRVRRV